MAPTEKIYNPYENKLQVLDMAGDMLGIPTNDYVEQKYPESELMVSIPVEMGLILRKRPYVFSSS